MARPEIYVSVDIEADGPIPAMNSMKSLGAAPFVLDPQNPRGWRMLDTTFKVNLFDLPGATPDPNTMEWWKGQPEAWAAATSDQQPPEDAMKAFKKWLLKLPGKPVVMGYPVTYDFMWMYWYLIRFTGFPAPCGFQGMDLKTMARDRLGRDFRAATKRNMPRSWFKGAPPHTHDALDDAIGQGVLGMNMLVQRLSAR